MRNNVVVGACDCSLEKCDPLVHRCEMCEYKDAWETDDIWGNCEDDENVHCVVESSFTRKDALFK